MCPHAIPVSRYLIHIVVLLKYFYMFSLISIIMLFSTSEIICVSLRCYICLCVCNKYTHICVHTELITETSTKMENFDKKKNLVTFKIVKSI